MKKRFELRWLAAACLAFAVLASGCPTDVGNDVPGNGGGDNEVPGNGGGNNEVSGIPETYSLSEIWGLLLHGGEFYWRASWESDCGIYVARFEAGSRGGVATLSFGVSNRVVPVPEITVGPFGTFSVGGTASYPFYGEDRLSMVRTAEGSVSWTARVALWGGVPDDAAGIIKFDYSEYAIHRVAFYITAFRISTGAGPLCQLHRVEGLNGIWLYRRF